jgi:hypothetical protein
METAYGGAHDAMTQVFDSSMCWLADAFSGRDNSVFALKARSD